jgi:hypothetical protein
MKRYNAVALGLWGCGGGSTETAAKVFIALTAALKKPH